MKLLSATIAATILASPVPDAQKRPTFVRAAFARLPSNTPELQTRFQWPATGAFQSTHQKVASATPIRLIGGRAAVYQSARRVEAQVVIALDPSPRGGVLAVYVPDRAGEYSISSGLQNVPVKVWLSASDKPFSYATGPTTVSFEPTAIGPAPPVDSASWTDWTYATTLLALPQPVYVKEPAGDRWGPKQRARAERADAYAERIEKAIDRGRREAALAEISTALSTPVEDTGVWDDFRWGTIATWAEGQHAVDAALGIRARFQPVGRCSMDTGPQDAATAYADLCYAAGKLACFLDLQVQVMGDQFERTAYSSYGDAAHDTQSQRLRKIGIDTARFLRGLVFRFAVSGVERRELDAWRLARSMKEAGLGPEMAAFLKKAATNPGLDLFNRLRAAETYAYLRFHNETPVDRFRLDQKTRRSLLANIRAELVSFDLPEPAASWARGFGKED